MTGGALRNGGLVLFALLVGFVACEGAYRVYLAWQTGARAPTGFNDGTTVVYDMPPWRYEPLLGFDYRADTPFTVSVISGGRVVSCETRPSIGNARGNAGRIEGDPETADLRVLVLGDSFTSAVSADGTTWPLAMRAAVRRGTGRDLHVLNYGRDGMGVMQMVDAAAALAERLAPDLVVIAYITHDLNRPRWWRHEVLSDGWRRVVQSRRPDAADPAAWWTIDIAQFDARADAAWCARQRAMRDAPTREARDPVLRDLAARHEILARQNHEGPRAIDFLTPTSSFLLNRVARGNAFQAFVAPEILTRRVLTLDDFRADPDFAAATERLRAQPAPVVLLHLPVRSEIDGGIARDVAGSGMTVRQAERLEASLVAALGTEPIDLLPALRPLAPFGAYTVSETDWHPNAAGIKAYGDAAAGAVTEVVGKAMTE